MSGFNTVHRVNLSGGIIGLLATSSLRAIREVATTANSKGEQIDIIHPDGSNVLQNLLYLAILICTLGLWCPQPGYLIVTSPIRGVGTAAVDSSAGVSALPDTPARACGSCGDSLQPNDEFCGECGHRAAA